MAVPVPRNLVFASMLFVFAGAMHFAYPGAYAAITPGWVPMPLIAVYVSGIAEIAGGLGLLSARLRRAAGAGLILLLIAVFPANVAMLSSALASGASDFHELVLFLRLPIQPLLIAWIYRSAISLRS